VLLLGRLRLLVGIVCAAWACFMLVENAPKTVRGLDGSITYYSYIRDPLTRLLTTGDMLDIPRDLQVAALTDIPPRSTYVLLLPATAAAASRVGIGDITFVSTGPFLTYLLLPSEPVPSGRARYVICWECDMTALRGVRWLWRPSQTEGIGRMTA